ncbi:hypothetical protein [Catenulispora pinisilvae]|uniref:hypothetical protein n=1 Tax=Catenulispora pinisilvae TaxID=2705253 RepID=UPI001891D8DF|nr:hypothetical protein [Catenulispora pinisilvae]
MSTDHLMTADELLRISKAVFEAAKDKAVYVAALTTAESRGGAWPDFRNQPDPADIAQDVAWIAGQAAYKGAFGYCVDLAVTVTAAAGPVVVGFQLNRVDAPNLVTGPVAVKDLFLPGTVGAHAAWEVISRIKILLTNAELAAMTATALDQ